MNLLTRIEVRALRYSGIRGSTSKAARDLKTFRVADTADLRYLRSAVDREMDEDYTSRDGGQQGYESRMARGARLKAMLDGVISDPAE